MTKKREVKGQISEKAKAILARTKATRAKIDARIASVEEDENAYQSDGRGHDCSEHNATSE